MHRRREGPGNEAEPAHGAAARVRHTTPTSDDDLATGTNDDDQQTLLARLQWDRKLRDALAEDGFAGSRWEWFADELARYGLGVMMAWLCSGEIFTQCKKKNCWPGAAPLNWTAEDRMSLANDTVAQAIVNFRQQALIERRWRFEGGASLKSFFVGTCVLAFPNHYRKWRTEQKGLVQVVPIEHVAADASLGEDPVELAISRMRIVEGFNGIVDDRTKQAIMYQEIGYTYDEIAELLDTTRGAVNQILGRHRRRTHSGQGSAGGDTHD